MVKWENYGYSKVKARVKNKFDAAFGRNIKKLRMYLDEEKYSISVPVSSSAHKDKMRIANKNNGNHVILKLQKNGGWLHEEGGTIYHSMKSVADNIDDMV